MCRNYAAARFGGFPGWGAGFNAADEKSLLQNQAEVLEQQLQQVRQRLSDME
jgi:hypothetical protein